jgi:hypothetical protein
MRIVPDSTPEATLSLEPLARTRRLSQPGCLKPTLSLDPTRRRFSSGRRKSVTFRDEEKGEALVDVKLYKTERSNKEACCVLS